MVSIGWISTIGLRSTNDMAKSIVEESDPTTIQLQCVGSMHTTVCCARRDSMLHAQVVGISD